MIYLSVKAGAVFGWCYSRRLDYWSYRLLWRSADRLHIREERFSYKVGQAIPLLCPSSGFRGRGRHWDRTRKEN